MLKFFPQGLLKNHPGPKDSLRPALTVNEKKYDGQRENVPVDLFARQGKNKKIQKKLSLHPQPVLFCNIHKRSREIIRLLTGHPVGVELPDPGCTGNEAEDPLVV